MSLSRKEILPNLYFIERGFLNGNHFVCKAADELLLIDTAYLDNQGQTLAGLTSLGFDWRKTTRIINTHCHCDHVGATAHIQRETGCAVAMHGHGMKIINDRDGLAAWWDYYHQKAEFFEVTEELFEGDEVELCGNGFVVLHTPGHSKDSISLYSRKQKILISADALWENDLAVTTTAVEGPDAARVWRDSIERLSSLEVKTVCPGHGPVFENFGEAVARAAARLDRFIESPEEIADDLLRKITMYTLLMWNGAEEETYFERLMGTRWFPTVIAQYFNADYSAKYDQIIQRLAKRGAIRRSNGKILPMVKR